MSTWIVNGRGADFNQPVEDLVRTYLSTTWIITDPGLAATAADFETKVRLGDFDYEGFSTYYIKVKEGVTTFDNDLVGQGLIGFQTPIIFDLSARRLQKGMQFQQLNNMRLEVIRIIGQYSSDDILGIPSMRITDPGDDPSAGTTAGGQSIWYAQVTAMVTYFKNYT